MENCRKNELSIGVDLGIASAVLKYCKSLLM